MAVTFSNHPKDQTEGSKFDDFDGVVTRARYIMDDFKNKEGKATTKDGKPVLTVELTIDAGYKKEGKDAPIVSKYRVGAQGFVPSKDGKSAVASEESVSRKSGNKKSGWSRFMTELLNIGYPEDRVADDITFMEGLSAHWEKKTFKSDDPEFKDSQVLCVRKIHGLDASKSGNTTGGTKKAAEPVDNTELRDAVAELVLKIVEEKGQLTVKQLGGATFKALIGDKQRPAKLELLKDEEFLASIPGIAFDGETVDVAE